MKLGNIIRLGMLLLGLPVGVQAQFTGTTNNGAITITGYSGTNGNAVIPSQLYGYPVTGIGSLSVGYFWGSSSLTNITIPASVTNIASGAFTYSYGLSAIVVDEQNAYYSSSNGALLDKQQTFLIRVPSSMAGSYAVPESVTTIGNNAFIYCASLTNISLGTHVTSIGDNAFNQCISLLTIAIPASVTNVGSGALAYCDSLTAISVDPANLFYSSANGILYDQSQTTLLRAPGGIVGSPAIPATVTSIGPDAFMYCASLTSLTIPDGVTNIGGQAFFYCLGLTSLAIPDRVISLGNAAFEYCGGLTNLTLGTNVTSIGSDTFYYCYSLRELRFPNRVTSIGDSACESCGSLTHISLGTSITTIGNRAFAACSSLTGIAIPSSVTNIVAANSGTVRMGIPFVKGPVEMVANCSRLTAITVDENNLFYSSANGILYNKSQTTLLEVPEGFVGSYAIPGSVTTLGAGAFQNCAGLTSVAIPNSVTNIGTAAFAACGRLTAITVDGQNPFYRSLDGILFDQPPTTLIQFPGGLGGSYTVSSSITRLGGTAFSGCTNLTRITIPASVTNVGNSTFENCSQAGIHFAGNAPGITSTSYSVYLVPVPGMGYDFYNPNAEAVYYLPGTTGWSATFDGLPAYLWVPPFVCTPTSNSITINGFTGSGGALTIPDWINGLPVTAIASGVFDNAASLGLTNVILGTNLLTIDSYAFAACTSLTSITIPSSVTNIGSYAFTFCDNLLSVYFQGNAPGVDATVFFRWSSWPFFPPVPPTYQPPTPTTVYYLPGTTGWGPTFGGQPTVLWNPQALSSGASFGVRTNRFGFNITGATNLTVVVEAATNLASSDWLPVQTLTLTSGAAYFSDPQWTNFPGRYYRLRSPQ